MSCGGGGPDPEPGIATHSLGELGEPHDQASLGFGTEATQAIQGRSASARISL